MEKTTIELNAVATIGLDLAKHVFQVHAVDAAGRVVMSRALRRKMCWHSSSVCRRA
ncbi:hypothetical protein MPLB_1490070 [Mesorhizobium sp. ORS 3324]|nr:hypothetical protein MPLB_1490070 [Mesorhizobium sp. ORS 3324]